jgi:hypothetical protein
MDILRGPFTAANWRRCAYLAAVLPAGIWGAILAMRGRPDDAIDLHAGLSHKLLDRTLFISPGSASPGRVALYGLATVPMNLAFLLAGAYVWSIVPMNLAFPLRSGDLSTSWGGPSLAGAWAVHALGGVVFLFVAPVVVHALTTLQSRFQLKMLGPKFDTSLRALRDSNPRPHRP